MASSSSPFSNTGKFQVLPTSTTLLFTPTTTNTQNGTFLPQQQQVSSGTITTPTSIVRLNQPISTQSQYLPQTVWTNNSSTIKTEPSTLNIQQQQQQTRLVAQPVVRQTVTAQQTPKFTESQINDFVAKCRTFLTTLLKLAEKQAPEKLPMVRAHIQNLLDGTIDPETFTQKLHTLYKSQPHTSLVPFFKLALPHMRQIVQNTFGRPITIELLEKLNLPSNKTNTSTTTTNTATATATTTTPSRVVVNPSLLTQQSTSIVQQPFLYTTVQPQQKINLLQQTSQSSLIGSTASLLGQQQQQQQQQARAQISITGIRPLVATVSPSSNTNLLTGQQIQPVTQTIIQPSDSLLQRTFLSPTTGGVQQPQIITVNHQQIRTNQQSSLTNISSLQQSQIQIQQRTILKNDDDSPDDILGNNGLLTTSSGPIDDRHTRHIAHDDRFIPSTTLRKRLDHLVKTKRWEGGTMLVHDDSVSALISHGTEQRLKYLIEQIRTNAHQRENLLKLTEEESDDIDKKKRKLENNSHQQFKKLNSTKRKCRGNLQDLVLVMEQDKHLKRSTLLYKVLDKSSEKLD